MIALNLLDILCFLAGTLSVLVGAASGAVKLSIGFIFFLLSIVLSYMLFAPVGEAVAEYLSNQFAINLISLCLSYLIAAVFCAFVAKLLKKLVEDITGGFTDRALGAVVGIIRGLALSMIIFFTITIFTGKTYMHATNILELVKPKEEVKYPKWVRKAICYDQMNFILGSVINLIGEESLRNTKIPKFHPKRKPLSQDDFPEMREAENIMHEK